MTIGVGFLCEDGVVIAGDRQVSARNYTFRERKVFSLGWQNGGAVWSYAGNRDKAMRLKLEAELRFDAAASFDRHEIRRLWEKLLGEFLRKSENFQALFGSALKGGEHWMWLSNGREITEISDCEIIGVADSPLSRYLRGNFIRVPGTVTVQQARLYAAHFISLAEQYDGIYCSGGADVGEATERLTRIFDAPQTEEWAKQMQELEYRWGLLFRVLSNRAFEFDIGTHDYFVAAIVRFKNWLKG